MLNKVMIIGRLGASPETKFLPNGTAVTTFPVATTESWKKDGEKVEKTEWHRIVTYDKMATICGEYLEKGKLVYLEGKIQTKKWQDKDGNDRYSTEIIASAMRMLTSADRGESPQPSSDNAGEDVPF
jgi:single-strand DNA-binding protein